MCSACKIFLNRMLQTLRDHTDKNKIKLDNEFYKDLNWFNVFLRSYNGVTFYSLASINTQVHLDACLSGLGGQYGDWVYSLPLPDNFSNLHITQLEMLNVIVALKVWAKNWANQRITLYCDNLAVVEVLNSGKTRDAFLGACARNAWLIMSTFNIHIHTVHIPGKMNYVADLLSRWHLICQPIDKLKQWLPNFKWIDTHIDLTMLNMFI